MESLGHHGVRGDLGSRPNSLSSVDGGKASHAPSIHEQGQAVRGTMDIVQQIAQALQRAVQPAQVVSQRTTIVRMTRYRPIDFLEKKDNEPFMEKNWHEITKRMLQQLHCTPEENLEYTI